MVTAKERKDFIKNILIPKLQVSDRELQKFNSDKLKYLTDNNYPISNSIDISQVEENFKNFPDVNFPQGINANPFCSAALRITLYGTVVIGALVTDVIVFALAVAVAPYCGGLSIAMAILAQVGIVIGVMLSVFLIEKLVSAICGE